jgi:hypothetical protein
MITKIISGGQTGADQGGLLAGEKLGIPTGGIAPKGYRTESGTQEYYLRFRFKLKESNSKNYDIRTEMNVIKSHGTVIFMFTKSTGSEHTIKFCKQHNRPYYVINAINSINLKVHVVCFLGWLKSNHIGILNVAGNRESKFPKIEQIVMLFLVKTIGYYNSEF